MQPTIEEICSPSWPHGLAAAFEALGRLDGARWTTWHIVTTDLHSKFKSKSKEVAAVLFRGEVEAFVCDGYVHCADGSVVRRWYMGDLTEKAPGAEGTVSCQFNETGLVFVRRFSSSEARAIVGKDGGLEVDAAVKKAVRLGAQATVYNDRDAQTVLTVCIPYDKLAEAGLASA